MSAQNDAAFLRMFLVILGALLAFTAIILIAANQIIGSVEEDRGEDPRQRAAVAERIKPVGRVDVAVADAAPAAPKSGADIVASACFACHGTGVLGAPKIGDKAAWEPRLQAANGLDGLTASAIKGKGGMPPKGGAMVSDAEIRAAIENMLTQSGVDLAATGGTEPAPASAGPVEAVKEMASSAMDVAASAVAAVMPESATPETAPAADLAKGKAVYGAACFVCHDTGAAGAPKRGDKAVWAPRIEQGMEALTNSALKGKNAMPPKGGRMDLSDADIAAAVAYLVSQAQ